MFDLWAGEVLDGAAGQRQEGSKWVINVKGKKFTHLGWVDFDQDGYESFYGKKAAASRVVVERSSNFSISQFRQQKEAERDVGRQFRSLDPDAQSEILREVWVRGPHHREFKKALRKRWNETCSVHGVACDGQLRASHIVPWSKSVEKRADVDNGLLLSVPLDALFDSGLIAFSDSGELLQSKRMSEDTAKHFGLRPGLRLAWERIEKIDRTNIQENLAFHRKQHAEKHGYVS